MEHNHKRHDMTTVTFKPIFIERFSKLTDFEAFKAASLKRPRRSIRVNTLKIRPEELIKRMGSDWSFTQIPWFSDGYWVEHKEGRRDLGNTLEHQLGLYYIQEAASMIPPLAINPEPGSVGLDLCASPGSKTSELCQLMGNTGAVVANDIRGDRLAALGMNLMRVGALNAVQTLHRGEEFSKMGELYDWVLCDAPCSGTGTISKSFKTIAIYNQRMITKLSAQQKRLIIAAYKACKPGGIVVYSTCSIEPEENEEVVDHLLKEFPDANVEKVELKGLMRSKPVLSFEGKEYDSRISEAVRLWPQDSGTDGFFVCKIRKAGK